MKVVAKYISKWEEGTVETNAVLNVQNSKIEVINIETADVGEDFEHLEKESLEVELPSGDTFVLLVSELESEEGQRAAYQKFVSAVAIDQKGQIGWFVVSQQSSMGHDETIVVGYKEDVAAFAKFEEQTYGTQATVERLKQNSAVSGEFSLVTTHGIAKLK
jgi:hypothetical protein